MSWHSSRSHDPCDMGPGMTVILNKFELAYVSVPKVACTSIKSVLFEIENGFPFRPFTANGREFWIHNFYHSIPFSELKRGRIRDFHRIAVVRDPIERALSCYSNRVVQHRELSQEIAGARLAGSGLPVDPDLSTFVANIAAYSRLVAEIGHHAVPMVHFLGENAQYYHRVYRFDELNEMIDDISARTGTRVTLEVMQKSRRLSAEDALTADEVALLKDYYAKDYQVFGAYF